MGVPKFFTYISERYPCLSELVKEFQIPDFDNLYLDMNGIIHVCSHPNDFEPYFSITEEKIFSCIFHYIEVLFNLIKPRKLFFMAVDGVAPRAKMNQQRARRFRTAKDAEIKEKEALRKSKVPLPTERFDSNCITPGTVFMDNLHSQLKYFVTSKISTDPLWQNCKIILSGHQTPGEGEHKIMDYIRYLKTQPDYDENTRHCLYGLDADLIMLGLCTHEPHFSLLREKVKFSNQSNKKTTSPDETEFYLLQLSLLREYLDLEFQELKDKLSFQYNLENIIDDWILMGFLVGNDFIPSLPDLHINKDALPILYKAYKEVLPTLDGYLNENGYLNLPRFEQYMERMAKFDLEMFEDTYANLAFLEEKTGRAFTAEKKENGCLAIKSDLEELIKATEEFELSDEESLEEHQDVDEDTFLWEFSQHKKNYYSDKLDYRQVTPEVLKSQAEGYIRAVQWNLHYYYQGCQSWSWFYPHHYAPYISDIRDFKDLKLDFEMGKPFQPFEQLLAVLPAASQSLLPEPYRYLMTSPDSPIIDFYPQDFETDLNGKERDWEAVVLIPFIDEKRLLKAMKEPNEKLTPEEIRRNQHGPMHVFTYTPKNLGQYKSEKYFPIIPANHALMVDVFREEIAVDKSKLQYGLRPGVLQGILYPEFPTLRHFPFSASLKVAKVRVFDWTSRGHNMILKLSPREFPPLEELAKDLLGKVVYINWPHLAESRAVAVSDGLMKYSITENDCLVNEMMDKTKQKQWLGEVEDITRIYAGRLGVEIGPIDVIVYALALEGRKCAFGPRGKITTEKIWSARPTPNPLQVIVRDVPVQDHRTHAFTNLKDAFPVNSVVFMLGQPHFGSMGKVLDSTDCLNNSRLKVAFDVVSEPLIEESLTKSLPKPVYLPVRIAACKAGVSSRLFSWITGAVFVCMSQKDNGRGGGTRSNVGLNMKFVRKNEELPGYTRKDKESWLFSTAAIKIVCAYVKKFSRVIEFLANQSRNEIFFEEIFPGPEGPTEMKEMIAWVKEQEHSKVERTKCGTERLDPAVVARLESLVEKQPKKCSVVQIKVKPQLLYKNDLVSGNILPVKSARHCLLDRVVSIRSSYTVPTGLRGYIVGIYPGAVESDYMYDILFDQPFLGGFKLNTSAEKVFRMARAFFLNITDANRTSLRSSNMRPEPIANTSLRPCYGELNRSAFAPWSHRPPPPPSQDVKDEFQEMWLNLQRAKPQEDALKKILKINKEEKSHIEEPVKWFFEKISKGSNECPRSPEKPPLNPFEIALLPKNKYYHQLLSLCRKRNMGQPQIKYLRVNEKVMAQVFIGDGRVYSGLPFEDKDSACESASFQALGALGEMPLIQEDHFMTTPRFYQPQTRPKGPTNKRLPPPNNRMPPLLPHPPSQWVLPNPWKPQQPMQQNMHHRWRHEAPAKPQDTPNKGNRKLNASALEFVPLQAITGKRNSGKVTTTNHCSKQKTPPQKKTAVVATFFNTVGTSPSISKPKRRSKIAAKLDFDPNLN